MRFLEIPADPIRLGLLVEVADNLILQCRPGDDASDPIPATKGGTTGPLDLVKAERVVARALQSVPEGPMISGYLDWPFEWDRAEGGDYYSPPPSFRSAHQKWSSTRKRRDAELVLDGRIPPVELTEKLRDDLKRSWGRVGAATGPGRGTSLDDYNAEIRRIEDSWFDQRWESPRGVRHSGRSWWLGRLRMLREIKKRYGIDRGDRRVYSIAAYKTEMKIIEFEGSHQAEERRRMIQEDPAADPGYGRENLRLQVRRLDCEARIFEGVNAESRGKEIGDLLKLWRYIGSVVSYIENISTVEGHMGDPVGDPIRLMRQKANSVYSAIYRLAMPGRPKTTDCYVGNSADQYINFLRDIANGLEQGEPPLFSAGGSPSETPPSVVRDPSAAALDRVDDPPQIISTHVESAHPKWNSEESILTFDGKERKIRKNAHNLITLLEVLEAADWAKPMACTLDFDTLKQTIKDFNSSPRVPIKLDRVNQRVTWKRSNKGS